MATNSLCGHNFKCSERRNATINTKELEEYLAGGKKPLALRKKVVDTLKTDPKYSKKDRYFLTREQLYVKTLDMQLGLTKKVRQVLF